MQDAVLKNIANKVEIAEKRIRQNTLHTPLLEAKILSEAISGKVYLKLENEQYTGSFKARGSLNKLLSITDTKQHVVTASTGNHGLGFSRAVDITGLNGTVFLPPHASQAKVKKLKNYPVTLEFFGNNSLETELHAKAYAKANGAVWVSPYNDEEIIAGQGTIGIELSQAPIDIDEVLITIGGGGLISGIGAYLKTHHPNIKIVGCQPAHSPEMTLSLKAGKIVDYPEAKATLSDGSAGGIEPNAITFELCQKVVDHCILVDEDAIGAGIKHILHQHNKIIEGAAAVTIASLLKEKERFKNKTVVLVICGGNIDLNILSNYI